MPVITALEYATLDVLYLQAGTFNPHAAADALHATTGAVERRAQRAIRKLAHHYGTGRRSVTPAA